METLNYKILKESGYNGYILEKGTEKVMQFGEGNFLRAFVDYFFDIANEKTDFNGSIVELENKACSRAIERGLLEQADENARRVVSGFIGGFLDLKTYKIRWTAE